MGDCALITRKLIYTVFIAGIISILPIAAGERTIPVDLFVMIDSSLSMAEPGKFDSLRHWVQDQLIGQMLIDGDWITIYQFYGKSERLLSLDVESQADREKIQDTIAHITPDGQYTDIGLALDTLKEALAARTDDGRLKILLLLTDLKQEAPWTSRYAGEQDLFDSPYLAEARQVKHDEWYEITLDMDIQNAVVKTTQELYASLGTESEPRELPVDGTSLAADSASQDVNQTNASSGALTNNASAQVKRQLPILPLIVVVSGVGVISLILVPIALKNRKKKKEEQSA